MKRFYKLLVFIFVVSGSFLVFSGKAEAQTVFTSATASPATARATCTTIEPVDFATVVSNVRFDVTTGIITYDIGLGWRSCTGGDDTRAYAIYGSPEICPVSGWYGQNGTVTDCVKYIGNPAYQGAGNGLQCLWGQDAACVSSDGRSAIVSEQGPGGGLNAIDDMTYQVPGWPGAGQVDGYHEFSSQMCQFYKTGANFSTQLSGRRCETITVRVNWIFQDSPDNGTCSAVMRGSSPVSAGETRIVDYTVRNTGGSNWGLIDPTERHRLRNQDAAIWGVPTDIEIDGSGVENNAVFGRILRTGGATSWGLNLTVPAGTPDGTYTFNWQIYGKGKDAPTAVYIGASCPLVVNVGVPATKPYFKIYGNDAMAGSRFTINGACSTTLNTSATFIGFNESGTTVPNGTNSYLRGAGAQHALFALATITEVPSAGLRPNPDSTNPLNLGSGSDVYPSRQTFANSTTSAPLADYGGGSGISRCIPDYFSESTGLGLPKKVDIVDLNPAGDGVGEDPVVGQYLVESTVVGGIVKLKSTEDYPNNSVVTIYVNGDARIEDDKDIKYADFEDESTASNITIVVKGDLYIDNNTNRLDGNYIAQPVYDALGNYVSGGRIVTCYDSSGNSGGGEPFSNAEIPSQCSEQLVFNGAVIAKQIFLLRSGGNVGNAPLTPELPSSANIAEVFNFNSSSYLKANSLSLDSDPSKYDSIRIVPPVF